jgi:hypothetical protein
MDDIIVLMWPDLNCIEEYLRCLHENPPVEWRSSWTCISKGMLHLFMLYQCEVLVTMHMIRCSLEKGPGKIAVSITEFWILILASSHVLLWYLESMNFAIWCPYLEVFKWSQHESFSYPKWNPKMTCPLRSRVTCKIVRISSKEERWRCALM